jgi:hypothetical protein
MVPELIWVTFWKLRFTPRGQLPLTPGHDAGPTSQGIVLYPRQMTASVRGGRRSEGPGLFTSPGGLAPRLQQ